MSLRLRLLAAAAAAFVVVVIAIVAIVVIAGDDDDGGGGSTEQIIQRVLTAGQDADTDITVELNGVPDDYPSEVPRYGDGELVATIRSLAPDGLAFISVYTTTKRPGEALAAFESTFAAPAWEVVSLSRSEDSSGMQFRQTNGSLEGAVNIGRFGRAGVTAADDAPFEVLVTVIDRDRGEAAPDEPTRAFRRESQPLPPDFPRDRLPVYRGATIIGSAFAMQEEGTVFVLQLVTPDTQEQVISFYQSELARAGWTVDRPFESSQEIELSFSEPNRTDSSGSVSTSVFLRETTLTEVTVQLLVTDTLTPQSTATPAPSPTPLGPTP